MSNRLVVLMSTLGLAACSGLDIDPISPEEAMAVHQDDTAAKGYLVYHPMVVVEIKEATLCVAYNNDGKCTDVRAICTLGSVITLPDYSKPYLVSTTGGLGKVGIDIKIEDGWRLGGIKNEVDNTAALTAIKDIATPAFSPATKTVTKDCEKAGLYKVVLENNETKLVQLESILKFR